MGSIWTLKDASKAFPALVEAALKGEPQRVESDDGLPVVVMSAREFELMSRRPKTFIEHILDAPKLPEEHQDIFDKREPLEIEPRDIEFD